MTTNEFDPLDDELTEAARELHQEWESPHLWPSIASRLEPPRQSWRWQVVAAAAVVVLALGSSAWFVWQSPPHGPGASNTIADQRLLSEVALAEIERSEAQYVRTIDELTRITAPKLDMPASPLLVNLRDRLAVIDGAIDEYPQGNRHQSFQRRPAPTASVDLPGETPDAGRGSGVRRQCALGPSGQC